MPIELRYVALAGFAFGCGVAIATAAAWSWI